MAAQGLAALGTLIGNPWKIVIAFKFPGLPGPLQDRRSGESQLSAGRSVGSIAQEVKSQQRMIIEHSVRSADDRLAVPLGIPGHTDARLNVVGVGLNSFLQSEQVVSRKCEPLRRFELSAGISTS